jgi:hypothetical protein
MTPRDLALALLVSSFGVFILAAVIPRARHVFASIGFFVFMTGGLAFFSNWAPPQARVDPPPRLAQPRLAQLAQARAETFSTAELAYLGELVIFGEVGTLHGQGKGQCPLCHGFQPGGVSERAPNLSGITRRAAIRITEPRYVNPDTIQTESFTGSGRARTADEYIAESHICPNCYVAEGYGVKGSNDRESPMAADHVAPIGLNVDEMIAVHTWLFVHDGEDPPSPAQIRADHERFLPPGWEPAGNSSGSHRPSGVVTGTDTPERMIARLGCGACHVIPTTGYRFGALGPVLIAKTTAPARIASAAYRAQVKAGRAHAVTPKQYTIESLMQPSTFLVPGYADPGHPGVSSMPDYSSKLTYEAAEELTEFLLSIDETAAALDGIIVDQDGKRL